MTTTDKAHAVIDELYGRKGFDDWWCGLPSDIKAEIIEAIAKAFWHRYCDLTNSDGDLARGPRRA